MEDLVFDTREEAEYRKIMIGWHPLYILKVCSWDNVKYFIRFERRDG